MSEQCSEKLGIAKQLFSFLRFMVLHLEKQPKLFRVVVFAFSFSMCVFSVVLALKAWGLIVS